MTQKDSFRQEVQVLNGGGMIPPGTLGRLTLEGGGLVLEQNGLFALTRKKLMVLPIKMVQSMDIERDRVGIRFVSPSGEPHALVFQVRTFLPWTAAGVARAMQAAFHTAAGQATGQGAPEGSTRATPRVAGASLTPGPLPPLELDWSMPPMMWFSGTAALLASSGMDLELAVEIEDYRGSTMLPAVCKVNGEKWVPYLEPRPWSPDSLAQLLITLGAVRASEHADARFQLYGLYVPPSWLTGYLQQQPATDFMVESLCAACPGKPSENAEVLVRLVRRYFKTELTVDAHGLQVLDGLIDREFTGKVSHPLPSGVELVACFLGQAMVNGLGGRWVPDPDVPMGFGVTVGMPIPGQGHAVLNVHRIADTCLKANEGNSALSAMYQFAEKTIEVLAKGK